MYPVSNEYINQLKQPYVSRTLRGTIGQVEFTEDDIVGGSFTISNQCSESGEVKLGSVYTAALNATFKSGLIERGSWKGLTITVEEGMYIEGVGVEYIPLGLFTVDEATHAQDGVQVVAYDAMTKFDKTFTTDATYGTPYQLLTLAARTCGVNFGMTQAEVEALPNGSTLIYLYTDNDIETWRDFLFWVAQTLCSFATIDREGDFVLRGYGNTSIETIAASERFSDASFSDYVTAYSGVAYTRKSDSKYIYYGEEEDNKLTYNLGDNPFLQTGTPAYLETICRNILAKLADIQYVPFTVKKLAGPVYDLGDIFVFSGGRAAVDKQSCLMYYDYSFRDGYTMEGFGSDPATAKARSKVDKQLQGIMNNTQSDTMRYYLFTNADEILIQDGSTRSIADIRFASMKATTVLFHAEVLLTVDTTVSGITYDDAIGRVSYIYNESEDMNFHPTETWLDGKHILNLFYFVNIDSQQLNHLVVNLNMDGGTVVIPQGGIKAGVYGQGLAATEEWDGTLHFEDTIVGIAMQEITVAAFDSEAMVAEHMPHIETLTDMVPAITMEPTVVASMNDYLTAYLTHRGVVNAVDELPEYDPTEVDIVDDTFVIIGTAPQSLTRVLIDVDYPVASVRDVQMDLTNCTFRFRGNVADNWKVYSSTAGEWRDGAVGMNANDVIALTPAQWLLLADTGYLEAEIIMTDANSTVTEFSLEYTEEVTE